MVRVGVVTVVVPTATREGGTGDDGPPGGPSHGNSVDGTPVGSDISPKPTLRSCLSPTSSSPVPSLSP